MQQLKTTQINFIFDVWWDGKKKKRAMCVPLFLCSSCLRFINSIFYFKQTMPRSLIVIFHLLGDIWEDAPSVDRLRILKKHERMPEYFIFPACFSHSRNSLPKYTKKTLMEHSFNSKRVQLSNCIFTGYSRSMRLIFGRHNWHSFLIVKKTKLKGMKSQRDPNARLLLNRFVGITLHTFQSYIAGVLNSQLLC